MSLIAGVGGNVIEQGGVNGSERNLKESDKNKKIGIAKRRDEGKMQVKNERRERRGFTLVDEKKTLCSR